jgi:colanic acid biosynthesis glycosyl transferase WcaI
LKTKPKAGKGMILAGGSGTPPLHPACPGQPYRMRLLLLNQFGGASGAPTGRILAELGTELERRGHTVVLLTSESNYGKPRHGLGRILDEGLVHIFFLWRSLWCRKVDAVISLTSPVCLAVTAGIIARLHQAQHFHWAMDLYPDVGARLGELKSEPLVSFLSFLMRRAYQSASCVVTLDEDMREYLQINYGVDSKVIEPFPPDISWPATEKKPKAAARRWLYSGNFGRAHEIEALLRIQKRLEERRVNAELVLQGQGHQFLSSQDSANRLGLRQVQWRAPVPHDDLGKSLLESEVLVVTRKPEMKGLLLPSKLVLAELSGRIVLWIGDTDGKTAQRLARENRHGVFTMDDVESIAVWLQEVFERDPIEPAVEPQKPRDVREQSVRHWEALLAKSGQPTS